MAINPTPMPVNTIGSESLSFPSDLEDYLFHITFDFRKFTRRSITDRTFYGPSSTGSVKLPIPGNMIDTTMVRWGDQGLGPILGPIIDTAARIKSGINTAETVTNTIAEFLKNSGTIAAGTVTSLLAKNGPNALNALTAIAGVAINPFMTVIFESPTFKRHQFQWHFNPHSQAETDTLRQILARFRLNALPSLVGSTAGLLLNYPNMCFVGLYPNNKDLYKFKPCVIESASINYAPSGPSFFDESKAPTDIILTLDLLEMEYWLQEDVLATWNTDLDEEGLIPVDTSGTANTATNVGNGTAPGT